VTYIWTAAVATTGAVETTGAVTTEVATSGGGSTTTCPLDPTFVSGASVALSSTSSANYNVEPGTFLTIIAPVEGNLELSVCETGPSFDTEFLLFSAASASEFAFNDDSCGLPSTIDTVVPAGVYHLYVFQFHCSLAPAAVSVTVDWISSVSESTGQVTGQVTGSDSTGQTGEETTGEVGTSGTTATTATTSVLSPTGAASTTSDEITSVASASFVSLFLLSLVAFLMA